MLFIWNISSELFCVEIIRGLRADMGDIVIKIGEGLDSSEEPSSITGEGLIAHIDEGLW